MYSFSDDCPEGTIIDNDHHFCRIGKFILPKRIIKNLPYAPVFP